VRAGSRRCEATPLRKALSWLVREAKPEDTVWIYYAGHSAPENGDLYWVPHDGDVNDLDATGLSNTYLHRRLEKIAAERVVVFLDSCHAAATTCQNRGTRAAITEEAFLQAFQGKGRITFASSDGHQKSVELDERGHGAFTWCLVQGLSGAADVARSGVVTPEALWNYLKERVAQAARQVNHEQTPIWRIDQLSHDMLLTLNPEVTSHKEALRELVRQAPMGLGEQQLETDEVRWLLERIEHGETNEAERRVLEALPLYLQAGGPPLAGFKALLREARKPEAAPAQGSSPEPTRRGLSPGLAFVAGLLLAALAGVAAWQTRENLLPPDVTALNRVVAELQQRLDREVALRETAEQGLAQAQKEMTAVRDEHDRLVQEKARLAASLEQEKGTRRVAEQGIETLTQECDRLQQENAKLAAKPAPEDKPEAPKVASRGAADPSPCAAVNGFEPPMEAIPGKPYKMGRCEVTQAQWEAVMGSNPSSFKKGGDYPVESFTWDEMQQFIQRLNQKSGKKYRLPTELEWEYAAHGGTTMAYWWGSERPVCVRGVKNGAKFDDDNACDETGTDRGGTYSANPFGLYDVHGNLWEWTSDCWNGDCSRRVLRSGSWISRSSDLSAGNRGFGVTTTSSVSVGFRLAQD
jgi:formylglycine-generating enzyme required for sulfatase activity